MKNKKLRRMNEMFAAEFPNTMRRNHFRRLFSYVTCAQMQKFFAIFAFYFVQSIQIISNYCMQFSNFHMTNYYNTKNSGQNKKL